MKVRWMLFLVIILAFSSCSKPFLEEGPAAALVGTWELVEYGTSCDHTAGWPDCNSTDPATCSSKFVVKKNGKVVSTLGDEEIWCDKIESISDWKVGSTQLFSLVFDEEEAISFWFREDEICTYRLPDPFIDYNLYPSAEGRVAFFRRE